MKTQTLLTFLARREFHGSSQNETVKHLISLEKLTDDDWYKLLENRVKAILEHLRDMSLETLGSIPILHDYFGSHDLRSNSPETEGDFNPDTRGIFARNGKTEYPTRDGQNSATSQVQYLWGMSRNGDWMTIEVHATCGRIPYKDRTERVTNATRVITKKTDMKEACSFSNTHPKKIWEELGKVAETWAKHRESLLRQAKILKDQFALEKDLVESIASSR